MYFPFTLFLMDNGEDYFRYFFLSHSFNMLKNYEHITKIKRELILNMIPLPLIKACTMFVYCCVYKRKTFTDKSLTI